MLILVTALIALALVALTVAQVSRLRAACGAVCAEWEGLCGALGELNGQRLSRDGFTPSQWRYLKRRALPSREAAAPDAGDALSPRWLALGGEDRQLLCVSYLPAAHELLPPLSAWSLVTPSAATMLGVLGTFYGIQSGLAAAELDKRMAAGAASSEQLAGLMGGAGELFGSMSFAFVTSLGGLGTALVSTLLWAGARAWRARRCEELGALLEGHFAEQGAAQSVEQLATELARLKREQREAASGLQRRLDDLTRQRLLDSADHQELIAEMMVQIDDLLSLHLDARGGEGRGGEGR